MMGTEDKLQSLLSKINIDPKVCYSNGLLIETLLKEIGDVSARYSQLAAKHLKMLNSQSTMPVAPFESNENANLKMSINAIFSVRKSD